MVRVRVMAVVATIGLTAIAGPAAAQSGQGQRDFQDWCARVGNDWTPGEGYGSCFPSSRVSSDYYGGPSGPTQFEVLATQVAQWFETRRQERRLREQRVRNRATQLNNQGVDLLDARNFEGAIPLFHEAIDLNRDNSIPKLNLMTALIRMAMRDLSAAANAKERNGALDRVEKILNEAARIGGPRLANPNAEYYREVNDALVRGRAAVEHARRYIAEYARTARELSAAQNRISNLTDRLAGSLDRLDGTDSRTVDLRFGDPEPPIPAFTDPDPEINKYLAYINANGFSPSDQRRINETFSTLGLTGRDVYTADAVRRTGVWNSLEARTNNAPLAAAAASGQGPALYSSGWQSGAYVDCVLFALATASGRPYGDIAARANELIANAPWRNEAQRQQPQSVFLQKNKGLTGHELIVLAESLGEVEIVRPSRFAEVLRGGRPVMAMVTYPNDVDAHQVVLSRTFEREGATWYEMIDSQRAGPGQRTFVRADELAAILGENGIVFQSDTGRTPALLR